VGWDEVDEGAAPEGKGRVCQGESAKTESRRCRLWRDSQVPGQKNQRVRRESVGFKGARGSPDVGAYAGAGAAWMSSAPAEDLQGQG